MQKLPDRYLHPGEADVFWGELSPCEHMVQIYKGNPEFLDALEMFVAAGLRRKEAVIIIATPEHRKDLEGRLRATGLDIDGVIQSDRYLALDAEETLASFMRNGWPDDLLFEEMVEKVLKRAKANSRKVRAFGEMVALLWGRGEAEATIRLEHLWHRFCSSEAFCLFCAYPEVGFTQDTQASLREICAAHTLAFA